MTSTLKIPEFLRTFDWKLYERSKNYLVLDLETTSLDKGSGLNKANQMLLWVAYQSSTNKYLTGTTVPRLLSLCRKADFIVCHNAKFELQWLYRLGIDSGSILCYDTLLAEKVLRGNQRTEFDLDSVALRYGLSGKEDIVRRMIHGGVDPSDISPQRLRAYCQQDVEITLELFQLQLPKLIKLKLLPVLFTRCLTCMILSDIEANGMCLDQERVQEEYKKALIESQELLSKIHDLTGGINPKSPAQVGEYLYTTLGFEELTDFKGNILKTDGGAPCTGEEVISQLKPKTKAQEAFLEVFLAYIPTKKKLETLKKLSECCANDEGMLYFNYNQHIAATHRTSSNGKKYKIQGQNIDRDFKRLFKAKNKGWLIGDIDETQMEFRGAGFLTKDRQIFEDAQNKIDVHLNTAVVLHKKPRETITKAERTDAKPFTFRPLYGGSSGTPELKRYILEFRKKYKECFKGQQAWTFEVARTKQLKLASGLIFYWPDCQIKNGYVKYTTNIFNYPVQSFCGAEMTPLGLVYLWYRMKEEGLQSYIINTVHDSVVVELHPDEIEQWYGLCNEAFLGLRLKYLDAVYGIDYWHWPMGIAYSASEHWGEGKDIEVER